MVEAAEGSPESDAPTGAGPAHPAPRKGVWKPTQELRIALAMRGGVSLAVWIGGAVAELDVMRRGVLQNIAEREAAEHGPAALPDFMGGLEPDQRDRARAYGAFIGPDYVGVRIDVLAGASAGGLNAVLYGTAQSLGAGVQWMGTTWRNRGDLWALMRLGWRPGEPYRVESVLTGDGDEGFYGSVLEEMTEHLAKEHQPGLESGHLSIDLAATLEAGPPVLRGGKKSARRPEAHFHFRKFPRGAQDPGVDDFPSGVADTAALERLAYAARTTSSFPGAFEPARFHSVDPAYLPPASSERVLNMYGVFSETTDYSDTNSGFVTEQSEVPKGGTRPGPALLSVFDGGVFDNIPIARGLDSISDMPADTRVDRRLFYLDPDPPNEEQPPGVGGAAQPGDLSTFFLTTTLRALRMKQRQESSDDDIATLGNEMVRSELAAHHRKVAFAAAAAVLTPPTSLEGEAPEKRKTKPSPASPEGLLLGYGSWRSNHDAKRLTDTALHPGLATLRSLNEPVPTDVVISQSQSLGLRFYLRSALGTHYEERQDTVHKDLPAVALDARSLYLLCGHLIGAAGQVRSPGPVVREAKQRLYLLRAAAAKFAEGADVSALVHDQYGQFDAQTVAREYVNAALVPIAEDAGGDPLVRVLKASPLDESVFWPELKSIAANTYPEHALAMWKFAAELAPPMDEVISGLAGADVGVLARLNAYLCGVVGEPNLNAVQRYRPITGSQPALAGTDADYPEVKKAATSAAVAALLAVPARQFTVERMNWEVRQNQFTSRSKLAGNQLGNFAGFLDGRWRDHDFEWGRRDAAAAISTMFGAKRSLGPLVWAAPPGDATQVAASGTSPLDMPRLGLGDLSARRRFALVSRMVHLIHRAIWPLTWSTSGTKSQRLATSAGQVLLAGLLLVLRVPLTLAPLAVGWVRLLVVLVLGLVVVRVTAPSLDLVPDLSHPQSDPGWVAQVAATALAGMLLFRVLTLARRWAALDAGLEPRQRERVPSHWISHGRRLSITALVTGAAIVVAIVLGFAGVAGLQHIATGWRDSSAFERLLFVLVIAVCAWLVPALLRRPTDAWFSVAVKIVALELAAGLLPWAVLALPDDASSALDLSSGTPERAVHAALAGILVAVVLLGWARIEWVVSGFVCTVVGVVLADPLVELLGDAMTHRAAMVLVATAALPLLILLLQLAGSAVHKVPGTRLESMLLSAVAMVGMLAGACVVAVLGQLLYAPFGSLGVPFGLWAGMFCAAVATVYVQPVDGLENEPATA